MPEFEIAKSLFDKMPPAFAKKLKKSEEPELSHDFHWINGRLLAVIEELGNSNLNDGIKRPKVKLCENQIGEKFTLKIQPHETNAVSQRIWEVLKKLGYFIEGFIREAKDYQLLTFIEGSDLYRYLYQRPNLSAAKVLKIALKLAWALQALHSRSVIHGDLHEANVMVEKSIWKSLTIIDFENSQIKGIHDFKNTLVLQGYAAPELEAFGEYSFASDIYALGHIFQHLQNCYQIDLSGLIAKMKMLDPQKRPTIDEVIIQLQPKNRLWGWLTPSPLKHRKEDFSSKEWEAFQAGYANSKKPLTWFDRKRFSPAFYAGARWYELNPQDPYARPKI